MATFSHYRHKTMNLMCHYDDSQYDTTTKDNINTKNNITRKTIYTIIKKARAYLSKKWLVGWLLIIELMPKAHFKCTTVPHSINNSNDI